MAPTTTTAPASTTAAPTAATAAGTAGRRKAYAVGARKISETIAPGSGFASQLSVVGGDPDETSTTIALGNEMYTIGELFPFLPALSPHSTTYDTCSASHRPIISHSRGNFRPLLLLHAEEGMRSGGGGGGVDIASRSAHA